MQFHHDRHGREIRRHNVGGFDLIQQRTPEGLIQLQRLTGENREGHHPGDRHQRQFSYDILHRLTAVSDGRDEFCYAQDGAGRIISEQWQDGIRFQHRSFQHDATDSLTASQIRRGNVPMPLREYFGERQTEGDTPHEIPDIRWHYDSGGRVTLRENIRQGFSAIARTNYRRDGDRLAGEKRFLTDGTPAHEVQWIYAPDSFMPLAQVEKTGNTFRIHHIVAGANGLPYEMCDEQGKLDKIINEANKFAFYNTTRQKITTTRYCY